MSRDAEAVQFDAGGDWRYVWTGEDADAARRFAAAVAEVIREAGGGVDPSLGDGGLDLSANVSRLAAAVGADRGTVLLGPREVRAAQLANLLPTPADLRDADVYERGGVASVRAFLKTCADAGYGILLD